MPLRFDWDDNKRERCIKERGIDFLDAAFIWEDPRRQERIDTRRNYGETRIQTIGKADYGVLFVVYTKRIWKDGQLVNRIISVRKAKPKEVQQYNDGTFSTALKGRAS